MCTSFISICPPLLLLCPYRPWLALGTPEKGTSPSPNLLRHLVTTIRVVMLLMGPIKYQPFSRGLRKLSVIPPWLVSQLAVRTQPQNLQVAL